MKEQNTELNPQQSLELITSMINQAKGNLQKTSFYFLLWGWVIAACNFGMHFLVNYSTTPEYAPAVWLLVLPAWVISMVYGKRQGEMKPTHTHLDRIYMWLWIAFGISIIPLWAFGSKINWMVNAVILLPAGTATFLSGIIVRFRALLIGGVTFWIAGLLCFILPPEHQYLIGGTAMILGYIIPGYLLRKANQ